jgi:hypothetical protein
MCTKLLLCAALGCPTFVTWFFVFSSNFSSRTQSLNQQQGGFTLSQHPDAHDDEFVNPLHHHFMAVATSTHGRVLTT